MSKHIIDGARTRDGDRVEQYTKIDRETSGKQSEQSDALRRVVRTREEGTKLRRFVNIERKS